MKKIIDKPKIEPEELAKRLSAEIIGEAKTTGGIFGAQQAYEQYKLFSKERYYDEFLQACIKGMPEKDCSKYFKRYDTSELPRITKVIGMLKSICPSTILDIGSGRGRSLWPIAYNMPDTEITCIDKVEWRVEVINAVHNGGVDRIKVLNCDITENNFADNSFDVVLALEVLEHIPDVGKAIKEALRVTSSYFIAIVPSKPDENPDHLHYLVMKNFEQLVKYSKIPIDNITFDYTRDSMIVFISKEIK